VIRLGVGGLRVPEPVHGDPPQHGQAKHGAAKMAATDFME
jgi:hypothetical protein